MHKDYSKHYNDINRMMQELGQQLPETMEAFGKLHQAAIESGSLSPTTKELIALGIAITVRCDGCIAFHVKSALDAGASVQEIYETIGVAILMGGGPSVVYGGQAMEALRQFALFEEQTL